MSLAPSLNTRHFLKANIRFCFCFFLKTLNIQFSIWLNIQLFDYIIGYFALTMGYFALTNFFSFITSFLVDTFVHKSLCTSLIISSGWNLKER